ncbi:MAG: hypothetical protein IJH12_01990 [Clostridia bacterium]|nr:hypothetical protein [Clostridia bacterium]
MSNERTPYLQELIRLSSKATLVIASHLFNEEYDPEDTYKDIREALKFLKNDDKLIVNEKEIDEEFIEISIELR